MNLLFLTPQLPYPPRQGTALRNWGLLRGLAARHTIDLVSFVEEGQEVEAPLRALCRRIWTAPVPQRSPAARLGTLLFSGEADMARRLRSAEFEARLRAALTGAEPPYDIAQVEGIELARYLPAVRAGARRVVYDAHNAETPLQRRTYETDRHAPLRWAGAAYSWVQARRLARLEAWTLRQADCVLCVSPEDRAALQALAPECDPVLIPNGIDLAEFPAPNHQSPTADTNAASEPGEAVLLFTGKMDYRPNVDAALWFADEILPRIRARAPQARFVVAGQRPHARLGRLAGRPEVIVTGAVPDLLPYLRAAAVYVAPLRMGGGTRFKLLEAMALGKAIVSTPFGAEGFAVQDGREMLLAGAPDAFASAALALLEDKTKRAALGRAARRFVEQGYDWAAILPRLEATYRVLVNPLPG